MIIVGTVTPLPAPSGLTPYLIFALGIVTGSVGYCIAQFLMQPILQYVRIRYEIGVCLTVFDNVLDTTNMNEQMKQMQRERRSENRRLSAELHTCFYDLPRLYRFWLKHRKGIKPLSAVRHLRILSTMTDHEKAYDHWEAVKSDLALPAWEQTSQ